jgi:hypothetical protein
MMMLRPGPDDLILDLGAGGCWCSDMLGRVNRRAVAVELSLDMLRARSGVLEQDIIIAEFARACRDAGFRDVRIKTLAYTAPAADLTPEEWQMWSRRAGRKQPFRALEKNLAWHGGVL